MRYFLYICTPKLNCMVMKKFITLIIPAIVFASLLGTGKVHGQCEDRPMGIAIVRQEDGKPEAPKAAMKFPQYQGGTKAMCNYLCKNMRYPESLKRQNIKGTTTVDFMVNSDGSVSQVSVVNSSGHKEFDDEAVRLVQSFPKWKPAEKDCEPTSMRSQVDVEFNCEKCGCK